MDFELEHFGYDSEGKKIDYEKLSEDRTTLLTENIEKRAVKSEEVAENLNRNFAEQVFEEWGVADHHLKGSEAKTHYPEGMLLKVDIRLNVLEFLPPEIAWKLFEVSSVDPLQVAGQMANGVLENSKNAFLLRDDFEEIINGERDQIVLNLENSRKSLDSWKGLQKTLVENISSMVTNGVEEENIDGLLKMFEDLNDKIRNVEMEIFKKMDLLNRFNLAFLHSKVRLLTKVGKQEEADMELINGFERYGEVVKDHPKFETDYFAALGRLKTKNKLSDFQKNLHFGNFHGGRENVYSHEKALKLALERRAGMGFGVDVLDQVKKKMNFNISPYLSEPAKEEFASKKPVKLLSRPSQGENMPDPINTFTSVTPEYLGKHIRIYSYGALAEFKYPLHNLILSSGKKYNGVMLKPGVKELLEKVPPEGMSLVLLREPKNLELSDPVLELSEDNNDFINPRNEAKIVESFDILSPEDFVYAKLEGNRLNVKKVDGKDFRNYEAPKLEVAEKSSAEDILKVLDINKDIISFCGAMGKASSALENLIKLFQSAMQGDKSQNLISFMQNQSKQVLEILNDSSIGEDLKVAKKFLEHLKGIRTGGASSELEKQIEARVQILETFIHFYENKELKNMLETILDKSKFHGDDFVSWLKYDGIKFLTSIVAVSAAIVSTIVTFGAATPFWAISAVATVAGTVGYELGAEALYHYHQNFDKEVKSGKLKYSERSLLGTYFQGDEIFDPVSKTYVKMEFLKDVVQPYVKDFLIGFVSSMALIGLGQVAANFLSKVAQRSGFIQSYLGKNALSSKILRHLVQVEECSVENAQSPFVKSLLAQIKADLSEEGATMAADKALSQLENHLGTLAKFFVMLGKGFKPFKLSNDSLMEFTYEAKNGDEVKKSLELEGFSVTDLTQGQMKVTTYEGDDFVLMPA